MPHDLCNESPTIVKMANLVWGVKCLHEPHPGVDYFDVVID